MCFVAFESISHKLTPFVFATRVVTYNFVVLATFFFSHSKATIILLIEIIFVLYFDPHQY